MGYISTIALLYAANQVSKTAAKSNQGVVTHHVANGGCLNDFNKAMVVCRGDYSPKASLLGKVLDTAERVVDVDECVKATAALRRCFAGYPGMFEHQYIRRIDEGLDQDTKPTPAGIWMDRYVMYRWWTGMRREAN